jgi:hypothetical protein
MTHTTLKLHLPQAVLRMRVAQSEERVALGCTVNVGDVVGVADNLHRRGDAGDRHRPVHLRQRTAQIQVPACRHRQQHHDQGGHYFDDQTSHARIIGQR